MGMTHATMTPAELLELAHGSPIQGFEALQETLPLRQSPVKWNGFDQASYPPLLYENVAENATAPPSQKRKRRGRQAKPTRQPPEEVLSPLSDEGESAKRMKLSSPVKSDDKSSPKPSTSDDTVVLFQGGLVNEVASNAQTFNRLCEQIRDIHQELTDVLQTLNEPLQRLQDMQRDVQIIQKVQSEVQRIVTCLNGS